MTSTGPDYYRQRLVARHVHCKPCERFSSPRRAKDRARGRAEKRAARRVVRADVAASMEQWWDLDDNPCAAGTCSFCMDGGEETDFERTRMAAAQRGAI